MNKKRSYPYFEYLAAHHYFSDVKLNLAIDQFDSGLYLSNSEWNSVENPCENLNFHHLWDELQIDIKNFYRKIAKQSFYSNSEINHR